MPLSLYNTLTRKVEEFKSIKPRSVGMYTCGPTVYNFAHIGNLRTYIFEDILKRVLTYNGYKVKHVMNLTDVGHLTSDADTGEDKMEKGAAREGKTAWDIANFYAEAFKKDLTDLNIITPSVLCKATEHIKEQTKLVQKLEKKGYTYITSDGVYFDTSKISNYGHMARLDIKGLQAGSRVDLGEKKNITDFALWKFSPKNAKRQMEWPSPWGIGFPGWHIECSAMSVKYLGQPFDIHCGGIDLIPVHHTNEIAQSEAAEGKPMANFWLHGEFLNMGSEKMAKSTNNFVTLQTLKDKNIPPLAYRYLVLQTHYRKQMSFTFEALLSAQNGLEHLYNAARQLTDDKKCDCSEYKNKFNEIINNDMDMPSAMALVWEWIKNKKICQKTLLDFDKVLGLEIENNLNKKEKVLSADIQKIISARDQARAQKKWAESDRLRKQLEELGYKIEDKKI